MWFKYGLKAQKLLAQGIVLGIIAISKAPCKGKSLCFAWSFKAFALTGVWSKTYKSSIRKRCKTAAAEGARLL